MGAAAVAVAALGAPAPAQGRATIEPDRVVVRTARASAVVERRPLRIRFLDRGGREVLAQVPNRGAAPVTVPPVVEPQPGGGDSLDGPALYAPFPFLVGTNQKAQYPATSWVGNMLAGFEAGTLHSARDVVAAVPYRTGGARLTVTTSDPQRRLDVTVNPLGASTIRVRARVTPDAGVASAADSFATSPGEAFRGFGGRHNAIDQRGEDFYGWVQQQNTDAGPFQPVANAIPGGGEARYQFPNGATAGYWVQDQFVSSRGYGFMGRRDELTAWRLASDRPDAWQFAAAAPVVDYVVAPGAPPTAIRSLTAIGGRHRVPPEWGLGPMMDRLTRFTGETAETYTRAVMQDLDDIERFDLPLTAYRIEAWEFLSRDTLRQVIARLKRRRIRPLVYFRAFVGRDEIGTDRPAYFDEATRNGYVARTPDGRPYVFASNFNAEAAMIDFTNPAALRWWERRVHEALDLGAEGFMQDFGEQVLNDMVFADGTTGAEMHNRYPVLFHRATRRILDRYERRHPGRRLFFYTRSGWTGAPAYEHANFPGDEATSWTPASGLASLAPDMLNRAIGGAYGYGTDIGGYFDFVTPPTPKELFVRWAQWAALSPVFRLHGSINAGTHAPWSYDAETLRLYKELSELHRRARPLILRLWREARDTGMPVTRPLWLQFPGDPAAARRDQEWMLGPDVLVAPVVVEGARTREVHFPPGCWRSPDTGETHRGPVTRTVPAPLQRLPWFVRCGTSPIPRAP